MKKEQFLEYCQVTYGITPDYPFADLPETPVLRHSCTRKWFAIAMRIPRSKLDFSGASKEGDAAENRIPVDIVNLKLPVELRGSFGPEEGVFPAYHMNKTHWISVLLSACPDDLLRFLIGVSYDATAPKRTKLPADHGKA